MSFLMVAYDIPCHKRRTRLHKQLKNYGEPVQYSVFEFELTPKQRNSMMQVIKKQIKEKEDRVRVYELCGGCRAKAVILGEGQHPDRGNSTLFV